MDKKAYLAPDTLVVEMELTNMVCFSEKDNTPGYGGEIEGEGPDE